MDIDPVPAADPPSASASPLFLAAAGALRSADAATRMGVRRHPVVLAAIRVASPYGRWTSPLRSTAGRQGNLDLPLIRTLACDLGQDLDRARRYALVRHLKPHVAVSRGAALVLAADQALGQAPGGYRYPLIRCFEAAVDLARELAEAVCSVLGSPLSLRFADDLEMACDLAEVLGSDLGRVFDPFPFNGIDVCEQALDLALERSRALDRVRAQNLAGRLGIAQAEGLPEAVLEGALDDFTNSDLTHASLVDADLTAVRWSLSGTIWPPGTDVKALQPGQKRSSPAAALSCSLAGA